jgi:hypothetical protein
MKRVLVFFLMLLVTSSETLFAQCAMCRTTIENNYSNGDPGIAAGINTGILYLLSMPYLAIIIIGYLWYKSSKNASKELSESVTAG